MATAEMLAEFRSAQRGLVVLAKADLLVFWSTLEPANAVATSAALQTFMPQLITEYGDVAATVAADFFDTAREGANVKRAYRAVISDPVPTEAVQANVRYNLKPLFGKSNPDQALSNLNLVTDKAVKASGRNTIELNVERDPAQARFARVPTGAQTCKFCLMLASRGAIYLSQKTADDGYHGDCDCQPTPIWDENDFPDGYDPDALYDEFKRREQEDRKK